MTSQEKKARELIEKFSPLVTTWDCYSDAPRNPDGIISDAKKCALIVVEQILSFIEEVDPHAQSYELMGERDRIREVKQEIENL